MANSAIKGCPLTGMKALCALAGGGFVVRILMVVLALAGAGSGALCADGQRDKRGAQRHSQKSRPDTIATSAAEDPI